MDLDYVGCSTCDETLCNMLSFRPIKLSNPTPTDGATGERERERNRERASEVRKVWGMMVFSVSSTTTQLRNVRVRLDGRWLRMDGIFAFATVWVIDYDNGVCWSKLR